MLDDFCHIGAIYLNITLSYNWGFEQLNRGNTCSIIKKAVGGMCNISGRVECDAERIRSNI